MSTETGTVTEMLQAWSREEPKALERVIEQVFADLKKAAAHYLQKEKAGHTLQTTALVNEVCLRLLGQKNTHWQSRAQFFSFAGLLIRRLLVDHARQKRTAKRGGGVEKISLCEESRFRGRIKETVDPLTLLALDQALEELEQQDARAADVVELKYFVGLNSQEIADVLACSVSTVKDDWAMAKKWLARRLA